ncbi:MAG: hypothetical protein HYX72_05855 [Acidobacteria bacterium]|nr:hypothetical protein [Acidobacteriota bacterium]
MLNVIRSLARLAMTGILACAAAAPSFATDDMQSGASAYSVVISGLGGDPEYEKLIQGWGKDLSSVLKKNAVAEDHVFWLAAKKEQGVNAESRLDEIVKTIDALAARLQPQDALQIFLIGHGSFDEYDYRLGLPGPDLTAGRLNELLSRIRAERQVIVNMTSSSGASVPVLKRKGRVVIASTSVGRERNFTAFPRYFIGALRDLAADADKNQEISALEAFRYATREVARYFESSKRIATEHAMLADRGDGEGARDPSPENGEGLLAATVALVRLGEGRAAADTPETRSLREKKRGIEEKIEALKYNKASMLSEEYSQQLEKLLIDLAKAEQQLDSLEKK